jgi:Protein related to penicillin acylase
VRTWVRVLLVIGLVLVLALVGIASYALHLVRAPFPQTSGDLPVAGLQAEVEVLRDDLGIPNIYADSIEDLFFAQGFVHAQDRFWEMDVRRHITAGRLSEMFGASQCPPTRSCARWGGGVSPSKKSNCSAIGRGSSWIPTPPA